MNGRAGNSAYEGRQAALLTAQKYRWIALLYTVGFTAASLQRGRPSGLHSSGFHAPLHLIVFIVFVILAKFGFPRSRSLPWIALAGVLLGCLIEFTQHWESQEAVEWNDIAGDALGVAVGSLLCLLLPAFSRDGSRPVEPPERSA